MNDSDVSRIRVALSRISRQLGASATVEGLAPSQASALGVIVGRGPLAVSELVAFERLHPTMVSRIVRVLDELGLIERKPNPADLREAVLSATEAGVAINQRIQRHRDRAVSECVARMPARDRALLEAAIPALETLAAELMRAPTDGR